MCGSGKDAEKRARRAEDGRNKLKKQARKSMAGEKREKAVGGERSRFYQLLRPRRAEGFLREDAVREGPKAAAADGARSEGPCRRDTFGKVALPH